ncbi:hypothetical protein K435DRAFT_849252 [Dendrothele bispora CBS 962.96]|uniref:Uncharacterized protein n=1 Tax=Dendrothele bispora (strain CBS 962.96) TaxID=1314807 RepID=A0A4S8MSL9_DENBC|nr:hypothetical protein K435DRAFT_849252 [Dendrothele bispora CBS 962.96]
MVEDKYATSTTLPVMVEAKHATSKPRHNFKDKSDTYKSVNSDIDFRYSTLPVSSSNGPLSSQSYKSHPKSYPKPILCYLPLRRRRSTLWLVPERNLSLSISYLTVMEAYSLGLQRSRHTNLYIIGIVLTLILVNPMGILAAPPPPIHGGHQTQAQAPSIEDYIRSCPESEDYYRFIQVMINYRQHQRGQAPDAYRPVFWTQGQFEEAAIEYSQSTGKGLTIMDVISLPHDMDYVVQFCQRKDSSMKEILWERALIAFASTISSQSQHAIVVGHCQDHQSLFASPGAGVLTSWQKYESQAIMWAGKTHKIYCVEVSHWNAVQPVLIWQRDPRHRYLPPEKPA